MVFDWTALSLYLLAALALLGAPGSVPLALAAAGRRVGWRGTLPFFLGVEVGLGIGAALTAAGIMTALIAVPSIKLGLMIVAVAYLLYLAWRTAFAPIGRLAAGDFALNPLSGVIVGIANPKGFAAFAAIMAGFTIVPDMALWDGVVKWAGVMAVVIAVDIVWIAIGILIGSVDLSPRHERMINIGFGIAIVATAIFAFLTA